MSVTLQDLKDIIDAAEDDLSSKGFSLSEVPIQKDFLNEIKEIRIDVNDYLGHPYIQIELS